MKSKRKKVANKYICFICTFSITRSLLPDKTYVLLTRKDTKQNQSSYLSCKEEVGPNSGS
jgi:hypothetical protein